MALSPKQKLQLVLAAMAAVTLLVFVNPFVTDSSIGPLSKELHMAVNWILEFLVMAYLWSKFNKLRILINKKELEDEKLLEIEHDVEKLAQLESSKDTTK